MNTNEVSSGEFIDQLRDYQLFKDSAKVIYILYVVLFVSEHKPYQWARSCSHVQKN